MTIMPSTYLLDGVAIEEEEMLSILDEEPTEEPLEDLVKEIKANGLMTKSGELTWEENIDWQEYRERFMSVEELIGYNRNW